MFKTMKNNKLNPTDIFVKILNEQIKIKKYIQNPSQYLMSFFDYGYYFGYLPYRFSKLSTGAIVIRTSKLRMFFVAIIHILTIFRFLTAIREVPLSSLDPTTYFEVARNCATLIYMTTFMYDIWSNKLLFLDIFYQLQRMETAEFSYPTKFSIKFQSFILCFLYTLIAILNIIAGHGIIRIKEWNASHILLGHAAQAKYMSFLHSRSSEELEVNFENIVLGIGHIIVHFYFKLAAHYTELILLLTALTLRHLAKGFAYSIKTGKLYHASRILTHYNTLKSLARKINLAIGGITLCCVFEAMPYYATHIGDILSVQDYFVRFRYIFFIINFSSIMIFAGDITNQMSAMNTWLNTGENYNTLPNSKLILLLNELSSHPVSLSAKGLFCITYGFIGTLASIVVTYAVIILQFKSSVGCSNGKHDHGVETSTEDLSP